MLCVWTPSSGGGLFSAKGWGSQNVVSPSKVDERVETQGELSNTHAHEDDGFMAQVRRGVVEC